MPFHNTISSDPQLLLQFEAKALSDEELIIELFNEKRVPMAWFEVKGCREYLDNCSIKARLTDLTKIKENTKGEFVRGPILYKTTEQVRGLSSKNCYRYALLTNLKTV